MSREKCFYCDHVVDHPCKTLRAATHGTGCVFYTISERGIGMPFHEGPMLAPLHSEPPSPTTPSVDATLAERGARYGKFIDHARIAQTLKHDMFETPNWNKLSPSQREALEMIAHKIGRILNGDPNYHDSWHDIAGYSKLVADELLGNTK